MTAREVAMKLLMDSGCSLDCYQNDTKNYALSDCKLVASERLYGIAPEEVAKALQQIGDEQPVPPPPPKAMYRMIYDGGHFIDGIDCSDFYEARIAALDTLCEWQGEMYGNPDGWDLMISECGVWIERYDAETDDYIMIWEPDYEKDIGMWKYVEEMTEEEKQLLGFMKEGNA